MSKTVCCPTPTYLPSAVTTLNPCPQDVGQVQKLIFWRTGNSIASVTTALVSTTWTTLLAATGDTKAIVTPFINGPENEPGGPREFGGGNETRDGIPIIIGAEITTFEALMYSEDQDVITSLKQLTCEQLEVLFINENNALVYSDDGGAVSGFEIDGLFIGDKGFGGFSEPDKNLIKFYLQPNWSNKLEITAASTFLLDMVNS